ncbi:MAG TPA: metallophosphoesterase [Bacteroidota bacterium]|nr:metallophosphoesterase [Bacteroidota bacterium]
MGKIILQNENDDGIDRRGFLKCMAWAGTGALWVMSGGILKSYGLSQIIDKGTGGLKEGLKIPRGDFSFVQISDSHIGFNKDANPDVVATLQSAIAKINASPTVPSFMLHTGDLSHLSKPSEFDTLDQVLKTANTEKVFFVPGEHDMLSDNGKQYLDRYGKGTKGAGWYSFDSHGAHFIGLVNVMNLKAGGMGTLGHEQLEWIEDDVRGLSSSTPIVVFAHIPLWSVYPEWGWGTDDSEQALSYLKRFGSVTVLNGHIHQTMQKIEGNITFHTAMSTAFPQPQPGAAPSPGPMKVPAEKLRSLLGLTGVYYVENKHTLAIIDSPLLGGSSSPSEEQKENKQNNKSQSKGVNEVNIDNFSFSPKELVVAAGTKVTWTNRDDIPHTVVATEKQFSSSVLDTDQSFSFTFTETGVFDYYCSIHPHMTGKITVK